MNSPRLLTRLCIISAALCLAWTAGSAADAVFPGEHWIQRSPAEAGLNLDTLRMLADTAGGHGFLVRDGVQVFHWGDPSKRIDLASAAKPFYSFFLIKAVEEGKIGGFDDRMAAWEPRLNLLNPELGHPDRRMTWRQAAYQTTGYGMREAPGEAFAYNDWQMALFFDTLFLKAYQSNHANLDHDLFHPGLTDRIQCEDNPTMLAFGPNDRPGRIAISVRDLARFGLLFLHEGEWNGHRIISKEHARMAVSSPLPGDFPRAGIEPASMLPDQRTMGSRAIPDNQTDHMGSYSWLWWTNGIDREGNRHWPDAPINAYGAFGHGGQRALVVLPDLQIVLCWNDTRIQGREAENKILKLLLNSLSGRP
jgi:CubicO group peptidase (beta-lactamase class C family)